MKLQWKYTGTFLLLFTVYSTTCYGYYLQSEFTPINNYLQTATIDPTPSGMDLIDCVYVINLDERPERWEQTNTLLSEKGIHPNRFSAVNGWNLTQEQKQEMAGPYKVRMQGGPYGCLLSHFSIYKDALDRGFSIIWVFEDDIEITGDVSEIPLLLSRLSEVDPDWDIFYTDMDVRNRNNSYIKFLRNEPGRPDQKILPPEYYAARIPIGDDMMRIHGRYGNYSMILSQKGLKKITDYLSHIYVWTAIDCDIHFVPGIREYSSTKEIITNQRKSLSDTQPTSKLNPNNR